MEEDLKQVALFLSRQGNSETLLNKAKDFQNNGNLVNDLFETVRKNKLELNAVKSKEKIE